MSDVMDLHSMNQNVFDDPALYRICVRGRLQPDWAERLEMAVSWFTQENGHTITILQGELPDQAALAGILATLYDLHLSLLSLERLSEEESAQTDENQTRVITNQFLKIPKG